MIAAVSLTGAGLFGLAGQAQATPAVTARLTAQGVCSGGPSMITANVTISYEITISGKLTGLTPGHAYTVSATNGGLANGLADLGTADANGNLTVTKVVDSGGGSGYTGSSQGAEIYDSTSGNPDFNSPVASTTIPIADNCSRLIAGSSHDRLIQGTLRLIQQGDGNLVLYQGGKALWSTRTGGHPGAQTVLQGDANLVVYSSAGKPLWSSRTNQKANVNLSAVLILQGDKNLVLYERTPVSKVLWATYTN